MKKIFISLLMLISAAIVMAQDFDIRVFADTLKYNWNSPQSRYEFRDNLKIKNSLLQKYEKNKINIGLNISKSAVIPGLGHFQTKDYLRGQILLSTEIVLAGTTYFLYDKAMDKYDQYKNSTQIDVMNQFYTEANDSFKQASLTGFLFVAVWGYNLYDTYVVSKQYNDKLWLDYVKKENEKRIKINPNGITIKF